MSATRKLPVRATVAALLALSLGGVLGLSCGSDSSSETTKAASSQQEQNHPKHPRVPSEGGTTTIEPGP